jgi:hypothetical protein
MNVDGLFQNALLHKEHKSKFSYARGAIHRDGGSEEGESEQEQWRI